MARAIWNSIQGLLLTVEGGAVLGRLKRSREKRLMMEVKADPKRVRSLREKEIWMMRMRKVAVAEMTWRISRVVRMGKDP